MSGARIVLANKDYERHTTDEGNQFQLGLRDAGWELVGFGYPDAEQDVRKIMERLRPEMVVVHDKRDWDPESGICFDSRVRFSNIHCIAEVDSFRAVVVKDAGSFLAYHEQFVQETNPQAVITYYHERSVLSRSRFLSGRRLVRVYHSIDAETCASIPFCWERRGVLVSGALGRCYPIRRMAAERAAEWGWDLLRHPGYRNRGAFTPDYLRRLSGYKVHLATASSFGFALRKIIESVAMGCTPVTDLPDFDVLPKIDGALVRIRPGAEPEEVRSACEKAVSSWDPEARAEWAAKARAFYDWRASGIRLSADLEVARVEEVSSR